MVMVKFLDSEIFELLQWENEDNNTYVAQKVTLEWDELIYIKQSDPE